MPTRTAFASLLLLSFFLSSCKEYRRNKTYPRVPEASIERGEKLARQYCGSCHLFPDPSQLAAATWDDGVLPNMGPRLGIFKHGYRRYPSAKADPNLESGSYPSAPAMSDGDWQAIIDYYTASAPDSLPGQQRKRPIAMDLRQFEVKTPAPKSSPSAVTFLCIDSSQKEHSLLYGDLFSHTLHRLNNHLQAVDSVETEGTVVDAVQQKGNWLLCNIGNINPNNAKLGKAQVLSTTPSGRWKVDTAALFGGLARPVQVLPVDLNADGRTDYVVCEFGFITGSLSWYEQSADGSFQRHVIAAVPGAVKAYTSDENHDGRPDLWVLFAQGDENISLFINKGNGRFGREYVLRFPPSYGSTFFERTDVNGDGASDIVYTCGDNADYSPILKPYHGVYLFLNDGENHFRQAYFFPVNGCYKALARDYDGDGDVDIAAVSFFADYVRQPEESFVYLENKGSLRFQPQTMPESRLGRWITMDAGDLDGDGKTDLVLGNFAAGPSFLPSAFDWQKGPPLLFLKNKGK